MTNTRGHELTPCEERILNVMPQDRQVDTAEIRNLLALRETPYSLAMTRQTVSGMAAKGLLVRPAHGRYALPGAVPTGTEGPAKQIKPALPKDDIRQWVENYVVEAQTGPYLAHFAVKHVRVAFNKAHGTALSDEVIREALESCVREVVGVGGTGNGTGRLVVIRMGCPEADGYTCLPSGPKL